MAIEKAPESQQNIANQNINTNTYNDIKLNEYSLQSTEALASAINKSGNDLINTYATSYGTKLSEEDIAKQIDNGITGKYSNTGNILNEVSSALLKNSPIGKAYDENINRVLPQLYIADVSTKLNAKSLEVINDPNISAENKVQKLSDESKNILEQYISQVRPEFANKIKILGNQVIIDNQQKAMNKVVSIQTQEQLESIYHSIDGNINTGENASSPSLAYNQFLIVKNSYQNLVNSGSISAREAESYINSAKEKIFASSMLKYGESQLKSFNNNLNEKLFSDADLQKMKFVADNNYLQQQKSIEISQLKQGINFDQDFLKYVTGETNILPKYQISQEQKINYINNAEIAKTLYQQAGNTFDDEQKKDIYATAEFQSLPSQLKQLISSNVNKLGRAQRTGDPSSLGLDINMDWDTRKLNTPGIPVINRIFPTEKQAIVDGLKNPEMIENTIIQAQKFYGKDAPEVLKKLGQSANFQTIAIGNPHALEDKEFISGLMVNGSAISPTKNKAFKNSDINETLNNKMFDPTARVNILSHLGYVLKTRGTSDDAKEAFNDRYILDNGILYKGDEKIRQNENASQIADYYIKIHNDGTKKEDIIKIITNGFVSPDFDNQVYIFKQKMDDDKIHSIAIPFETVDKMQSYKKPFIGSDVIKKSLKLFGSLYGIDTKDK